MSYWLGHVRPPFSPSLCFVGTWGSRYPETVFIWFSPVSIEIWCPFLVSLTTTYLCRQNRNPHFTQELSCREWGDFPRPSSGWGLRFLAFSSGSFYSTRLSGWWCGLWHSSTNQTLVWATTHLVSVTEKRVGENRHMIINPGAPWLYMSLILNLGHSLELTWKV